MWACFPFSFSPQEYSAMGLYVASCPALNIIFFLNFFIREVALNSFYVSIPALLVEAF